MPPDVIADYLSRFTLDDSLRPHVTLVFESLPGEVLADFMSDPAFLVCDYDPTPRQTAHIPVAAPARSKPSRSVALKRTLQRRPQDFIRYVIAHELAHAHLRNRGRTPAEDPEHAADHLAATWGFPRPG